MRRLLLIRHGATSSNEAGRYLGQTEEALTEMGREELYCKKREAWYPQTDLLAASPMLRCMQTAELLYGKVPFFLSEKWMEINFGSWEGKSWKELSGDASYQRWIDSGGKLPFPNGESLDAFQSRCREGLLEFCHAWRTKAPLAESAALILHGGTIMSLLSMDAADTYYQFQCKNGEGYSCQLEEDGGIRLYDVKKLKGNRE